MRSVYLLGTQMQLFSSTEHKGSFLALTGRINLGFNETAHLPLPLLSVYICVLLGKKFGVTGGVVGQFNFSET